MSRFVQQVSDIKYLRLLSVVLLCAAGLLYVSRTYGDLQIRSLTLSDNQPGAVATQKVQFDVPSNQTIGSIRVQVCANSPLPDDPCIAPTGFDFSGAVLSDQTGETGFSISPLSTPNILILTRAASASAPGTVTYTLDSVVNPDAPGAYYGRLETFTSEDATGANNDFGGLAFDIASALQVSATVPPYLLFCNGIQITGFDCDTVSGNYINFGNFSTSATAAAETQMLIATNAGSGYTVRVNGTTLTSGNNVIPAMPSLDVSRPGVGQFGLNLVANTTPAIGDSPQGTGLATIVPGYDVPDRYKFVPNDIIVTRNDSDEFKKFTVSYIVNIPPGQPIGIYVSTLTYICLANF